MSRRSVGYEIGKATEVGQIGAFLYRQMRVVNSSKEWSKQA